MNVEVGKWGNSLAVRIPAHLAKRLEITEGTNLLVSLDEETLCLKREKLTPKIDLDQLISQITPSNRHGETDWGDDVGLEIIE